MDVPVPDIDQVDLDRVLKALADPLRRRVVIELLADGAESERACRSFALPVSKSTRTHHWRVLREAGLIEQRDAGNGTYVRLRPEFDACYPGLLAAIATLDSRSRHEGGK